MVFAGIDNTSKIVEVGYPRFLPLLYPGSRDTSKILPVERVKEINSSSEIISANWGNVKSKSLSTYPIDCI